MFSSKRDRLILGLVFIVLNIVLYERHDVIFETIQRIATCTLGLQICLPFVSYLVNEADYNISNCASCQRWNDGSFTVARCPDRSAWQLLQIWKPYLARCKTDDIVQYSQCMGCAALDIGVVWGIITGLAILTYALDSRIV